MLRKFKIRFRRKGKKQGMAVILVILIIVAVFSYAKSKNQSSCSNRDVICTDLVIHAAVYDRQKEFEASLRRRLKSPRPIGYFLKPLPKEIVPGTLLDYLSARDLCNVGLVCRNWFFFSEQDRLWRKHLLIEFNTDVNELKYGNKDIMYKNIFRDLYLARKQLYFDANARIMTTNYNIPLDVAVSLFNQR